MKQVQPPKDVSQAHAVVKPFLQSGELVYWFGSTVTRRNTKASDIDLGILSQKPIDLQRMGLIKEALQESSISRSVDVVDLRSSNPDFVSVVMQEGIIL